jgi:WD40 repeat protein
MKYSFNFQFTKGSVDKLSFSENGYYFSSACNKDGIVKIWDLRGEVKSINTI